jgi:hypothetical protein
VSKFPALSNAITNNTLVLTEGRAASNPEIRVRALGAFDLADSAVTAEMNDSPLTRWDTFVRTDTNEESRDTTLDVFVPVSKYMTMATTQSLTNKRRLDGIAFVRELFDADSELRAGVDLSLDQANQLLALLGGEDMTHTKEFEFSFTVSHTVYGSIVAVDEVYARNYVEQLAENIYDPDYSAPSLDEDDEEWGFIRIDYNDTEGIDVW